MVKSFTRAALLALVAGGLNLAVALPAQAGPGNPVEGRRCSFASVTDPAGEDEVQTGQVNAGPLVATAPGATIQIICTIQVGAANSAHNGANSCEVKSLVSIQTATIPPAEDNGAEPPPPLCSYLSPEGQPVYMCTSVIVNGVQYYWDATPPGTGSWTTSSGAFCDEAITQEIFPGPLGPFLVLAESVLCSTLQTVGPLIPPGLESIIYIGPDGDLYIGGIWIFDCPPYDNPDHPPFLPDELSCPVIALAAGNYGLIIIDDEGDIYLDLDGDGMGDNPDELLWDCPPYGT